jgi:hypothetical protein
VQAHEHEHERVREARQRQRLPRGDEHADAREEQRVLEEPVGAVVRRDRERDESAVSSASSSFG